MQIVKGTLIHEEGTEMSIDKQRVAAVEVLTALGFTWNGRVWSAWGTALSLVEAADRMHALLMDRAALLSGTTEGSEEDREFSAINKVLEDYEASRRSPCDAYGSL